MTPTGLMLLLKAVALVESGGNPHAIGERGERGAFQMMPQVVAECGGYNERAALVQMKRIEAALIHAGVDPQPYNLALAWNAGIGRVLRGGAPERAYGYARRVEAVFSDLTGSHPYIKANDRRLGGCENTGATLSEPVARNEAVVRGSDVKASPAPVSFSVSGSRASVRPASVVFAFVTEPRGDARR